MILRDENKKQVMTDQHLRLQFPSLNPRCSVRLQLIKPESNTVKTTNVRQTKLCINAKNSLQQLTFEIENVINNRMHKKRAI